MAISQNIEPPRICFHRLGGGVMRMTWRSSDHTTPNESAGDRPALPHRAR
jgi:hypothetical protein